MHTRRWSLFALLTVTTAACAEAVGPRDDASTDVALLHDTATQPDAYLPDAYVRPDAQTPDVQHPPDGGPTCDRTTAGDVRISLRGPSGQVLDCSGSRPATPSGGPGPLLTRHAAVVSVRDDADGSEVTLDFCSPAADCVPLLGTLAVRTPGFMLGAGPTALRTGQYVQIRSRASWFWGCTMQLEISNAPMWDGVPNPVRTDSAVLAVAASGERNALPESPFEVAIEHIGCLLGGSTCSSQPPELYALAFQGHCRTCERDPDPVTVYQGSTGVFMLDEHAYLARNARSFNSGACDDYWNYAWTVREIPRER